ncbi:MAG: hypothetical protein RR835_14115 [Peptostreptococcaceae bacterium]
MIIKIIGIIAIILVTVFTIAFIGLLTYWSISVIKLILRRMGYDF